MNKPLHVTQKGQSLVEMALSATMLMFLMLAAIDFGYGFLYWITIRDAAQEGAMYGSLNPRTTAADQSYLKRWVTTAAESAIIRTGAIDPNNIQIRINNTTPIQSYSATPCNANLRPGNSITVDVTHPYRILTPLVSNFIGSQNINLRASVTNTILRDIDVTCP